MQEKSIKYNTNIYNNLINFYNMENNYEKSIELYEDLVTKGFEPNE